MTLLLTSAATADSNVTRAFFESLFGTAESGYLAIWTLEDKATAWFQVDDLADAASHVAQRSAAGFNAYVGMGLQAAPLGPTRRGGAATVAGIPGAWDDIDLAGPAHLRAALPRTLDEALDILDGFPLPPSLLVHSGHGLYPFWLLKEVWLFDDAAERARAAALVAGVQRAVRIRAGRAGYDLETTSDLARVLRPAGAVNRKPGLPPVPVRLLEDTDRRYAIDEIEAVLPDEPLSAPTSPRPWSGSSAPRADLDRILAGCAFLRHCRDDAATLDEPGWHALVSIVARCRGGDRFVHDLSAPYPRYDPQETDRKFAYALRADKPLRCATIREHRGGASYCARCPHAGRITSPVVLGYRSLALPRIGRALASPSGHLAQRTGVARVG